MSRFTQYNKNDTYRDNYNYANIQKERRTNEELEEIERDRKAMERLQIELNQEKILEKERKNQIRQQQYEDYSNYMRKKYSETPQNREKLNIKLGGEQRAIRKPNYNQQMENLCLNPTKQENIYPTLPIQNFSEAGRNYQRGYSHGYNILTGETFSSEGKQERKTPKNIRTDVKLGMEKYNALQERSARTEYPKENSNREISNNEKDDLSQYQAYMEMKRQKEQEEMYYMQQQEKERHLNNNIKEQPQIEAYPQSSQNYKEYNPNPEENSEKMRNNLNEIPPEYREMYMRQQIERPIKQEIQTQEQEIPPEYREMYMRQQQVEQPIKQEIQRQEQEIPPEYREMYLRQQQQAEKPIKQEIQTQEQEIPPEYREMYMRQQQVAQPIKQEIQRQEQEIPPEYREMYMRQQQQVEQPTKQEIQRQEQEIPPEYRENYIREQVQKKEIISQQKQEIPDEYKDIIQQQPTEKHGRTTPYDIKRNNYLNQPSYHNTNMKYPKEMILQENNLKNNSLNNNNIKQEQISDSEYKEYLLSQQKTKEQEKEDENMEIYKNMLKEQEIQKEQMQNDKEREQYLQYLLNQQNQNQAKEQNLNQIDENPQYPNKYEENSEIKDNKMINRENLNDINSKQINSFDDYYKQKGLNIQEPQKPMLYQGMNENNYDNENNYGNYQQIQKEGQRENSLPPQDQGFDEQAYLMYQKQKQLQEMQEFEERERAKQILERQQMEKMNINNMNSINQENEYYHQNPLINNQIQIPERKSEYNSAKMEYLQNKQKNMLSRDNIFSTSEIPKPPPKYNNEPMTNADRLRIQREYAQFLDAQINAKNIKKNKNNGLGSIQSSGYDIGGPNPYQQLRDKHNKLKDIPKDPYSIKNYNISNNSYLPNNPITNPVNSYKFVDRRRISSGRLQNSGSNIVGK